MLLRIRSQLSFLHIAPALLVAIALTGCPTPTAPPEAVIAAAGASAGSGDGGATGDCTPLATSIEGQVGHAPAVGGGCSTDPQGMRLSYAWALVSQPTGSTASLHDASSIDPTFVPDVPGTYHLQLVVSNGLLASPPAEIAIEVGTCGTNAPELAVSAAPAAPAVGQDVLLTVMVTDPDTATECAAHETAFDYAWWIEEAPAGSTAAIDHPGAASPTLVPDVPGHYLVRVEVTDPTGRSTTTTVAIDAGMCGANIPTATASAAPSATVVGTGVQLQVAMADADTAAPCDLVQDLVPQWRLVEVPAGSIATITPADGERPSLTPDVAGDYIAEVVVTDSTGRASRPSRVTITASPCGTNEPIAEADKIGPGSTIACGAGPISVDLGGGNTVQLDALRSSDPDNGPACGMNQTLFYEWTVMVTPRIGADARLRTPNGRTTVLDAGENGQYQIRLRVLDETGRASRETICVLNLTNAG